jgi:putative phage-type endonuclease
MNTYTNETFRNLIVSEIRNMNYQQPLLIVEPTYISKLFKCVKEKHSNIVELDEYWKQNIYDILISIQMERSGLSYEYSKEDDTDSSYEYTINYLKNVYQPEQRTNEWYLFRYNHLTASNAWKTFGTPSSKNELIYEKCQPMSIEKYGPSLVESPMSWGHKYEPLTVRLYEHLHQTQISDFGCIEHSKYPFLAASPDGIVTGNTNYGRMIEIKNVVSREITGIPKKDYYIQMQLQMEVCDLDECDFVETKFTEYDYEENYINDQTENNVNHPIKNGVICVFIKDNASFHYEYMPFDYEGTYEEWIRNVIETTSSDTYMWFKNIFWKLEVYSCVLVKRKKEWFQTAVVELENIWKTICEERVNGDYVKRAPKKRETKLKVVKLDEYAKKQELDSLFELAIE